MPEGKNWAPADWGNVIADVVAGHGWRAGAELGPEDTCWPVAALVPGGRWKCRLKDEYVHDAARNCFIAAGEEQWHEIHGPLNKSMQKASATRAGTAYVARRLGERKVVGASRTEVWDHRPHEGRGGKGTIAQAVWKLKVVWDHAGTGTVRSRDIHQQIGRAEKRLAKLNEVEANRLAQAGVVLDKAIRSCKGGDALGRAKSAAEEGARVGEQLIQAAASEEPGMGLAIARRGRGATVAQPTLGRQTRGSASRAGATVAKALASREALEEEQAVEAQALQESGPEGRSNLVERGVEVQEGGRTLLEAVRNRDPGLLEKVRTRLGKWVTAGDEEEQNLGPEEAAEGKEWEGWEDVLSAWAGVGPVAASMRMVWTDRNRVWRKVEVALVEQQTGEAREGIAGGRGVWRVRAQALVEAVQEWLASNAAATDQAIRDVDGGVEPAVAIQNPVELAALVSATRPDIGGAGDGGGKPVFHRARNAQGAASEAGGHRVL